MTRECHVRFWQSARLRCRAPLDYLRGYATPAELLVGLTHYFAFYNDERPHRALGNRTPREVYATGIGGGASIPDHWHQNDPDVPATAQHGPAATKAMATA